MKISSNKKTIFEPNFGFYSLLYDRWLIENIEFFPTKKSYRFSCIISRIMQRNFFRGETISSWESCEYFNLDYFLFLMIRLRLNDNAHFDKWLRNAARSYSDENRNVKVKDALLTIEWTQSFPLTTTQEYVFLKDKQEIKQTILFIRFVKSLLLRHSSRNSKKYKF